MEWDQQGNDAGDQSKGAEVIDAAESIADGVDGCGKFEDELDYDDGDEADGGVDVEAPAPGEVGVGEDAAEKGTYYAARAG
ncbi:hypothetical protein HK104_002918 [Borealophlyctis nickersoniae]|nr:hypothetical protein HK104_002918 [Borealophlyctis nickersoniae]